METQDPQIAKTILRKNKTAEGITSRWAPEVGKAGS